MAGCEFRSAYFTPTFSTHAGQVCGGVQVHITDRNALRPVTVGIHLIEAILTLYPDAFAWREPEPDSFFIDLLLGSGQPRKLLSSGESAAAVMASWEAESARLADRRRPFLLYM
ncbi:hypothetical protein BH20CHL4_BH20CHL4_08030 [soil metagenome]